MDHTAALGCFSDCYKGKNQKSNKRKNNWQNNGIYWQRKRLFSSYHDRKTFNLFIKLLKHCPGLHFSRHPPLVSLRILPRKNFYLESRCFDGRSSLVLILRLYVQDKCWSIWVQDKLKPQLQRKLLNAHDIPSSKELQVGQLLIAPIQRIISLM